MRSLTVTAVVAASIVSARAFSAADGAGASEPRVIQHEIRRRRVENPVQADRRRMEKRAGTVTASLLNEQTLYFMSATIGTPAQDFELHIDTGSSDLWVNYYDSQFCQESSQPCKQSGTYNPNASSTYEYLNSYFQIKYQDGSTATGDYVSDSVSFADITLQNQQLGIGYQSTTAQGILGIGYPSNEVEVEYDGGRSYANVPVTLVNQGFINTNAYSLWLNDLDANTGSILFGGINTDKYTGQLETLPILQTSGYYSAFYIAMTAVGANGTVGSLANNIAVPALLDSGTSLMYLPNDVVQTIYDQLGARYDSQHELAYVDCNLRNSDATFDFTFSSPTIRVPMNELIFIAEETSRGQTLCVLGISPANGSPPVLGDTFLRSAYVVYDLDRNQISLAQTNFNSTTDNVLEITSTSGVPDATLVTNAVTSLTASYNSTPIEGLPSGSITSGASLAPAWSMALVGAAAGALLMAAI